MYITLGYNKIKIKIIEYKYEMNQGIYEIDRQEKLQKFLDKQNRIIMTNQI